MTTWEFRFIHELKMTTSVLELFVFFSNELKRKWLKFLKVYCLENSLFLFFSLLYIVPSSKCSLFIQELRKTLLEILNSSFKSIWMLSIFRNVALGCFQHDDWFEKKFKSLLFLSFSKLLSKINCSTWNFAFGVLVLFYYYF